MKNLINPQFRILYYEQKTTQRVKRSVHKLLKRNKIAGDDLRVQRKAKSTSPGSDRRMCASIIGRFSVKTLCMVNVSVDASTSTDAIVETMRRVLTLGHHAFIRFSEVVGRIHFLRRGGDVAHVCCRWIWHEYTSDKGGPSWCWSLPETFSARKSRRRRLMSRCRNVRIVSKNRVKKADLRRGVLRLQRGVNHN